jgi:hypothetical protein
MAFQNGPRREHEAYSRRYAGEHRNKGMGRPANTRKEQHERVRTGLEQRENREISSERKLKSVCLGSMVSFTKGFGCNNDWNITAGMATVPKDWTEGYACARNKEMQATVSVAPVLAGNGR